MIELQNLNKLFNQTHAVDDVSLLVNSGEFCMLIGSSGCGKSTTLRMINRLIEPTSGSISINGEDVKSVPVEDLRRKIGYAIQGVGLFPHQDIFENIATVPKLLKWSKTEIEQRVEELLTLFHLDYETFAHKFPHQLSGGQQQRVGVARALAARPELLLMDEPFGALDAITRNYLQDEMLRIQKQLNITIIMVTHDIEEAVKLGDKIAVMDKGKLLQVASPIELMRNPRDGFVRELVGGDDRALNLLSLVKVEDVMTPIADIGKKPQSQHLSDKDNLRDALSRLLWVGESSLPVINSEGKIIGNVALVDILAKGKKQK
ncbi:MAG: ABC transporter ATP-binding protein [Alphaproteobacteria bacterium]|nr:ABC transporter ATP-binding protein [Alphaproteobacteria bacterium]